MNRALFRPVEANVAAKPLRKPRQVVQTMPMCVVSYEWPDHEGRRR